MKKESEKHYSINIEQSKEFEKLNLVNKDISNIKKKLENINTYISSSTKYEKIKLEDFKRNICLLKLHKDIKKATVLIGTTVYDFDLDIVSYNWFVRYRIKTPFAIKKFRGNEKHCLYISFDFDRKTFNGKEKEIADIIIDDEVPMCVYLGDQRRFICIDIASKFKKDVFSVSSQINFLG